MEESQYYSLYHSIPFSSHTAVIMDPESHSNAEAGPSTPTVVYPTAPVYNFAQEPRGVSTVSAGTSNSEVDGNFFRSARWSVLLVDAKAELIFRCPDGTSILTTAEDRVFRIYDTSVHNSLCPTLKLISRPADTDPDLSRPPRCFTQPDAIHSSLWYPTASLNHPETFCFMASVRDTSIRLIDATDGRVCSLWK